MRCATPEHSASRSAAISSRAGRSARLLVALLIGGLQAAAGQAPGPVAADFRVAPVPREPFRFVSYGDIRFTATSEIEASHPNARQALVARIAADSPAAIFINGDVVWHGGVVDDYAVMRTETAVWRDRGIPVFPTLGNHEFSQCEEQQCLANWNSANPQLDGRRWYSVEVGPRLRAIALDTDTDLQDGSPQRAWLANELDNLPNSVDFVLIYLHHPLVADLQDGSNASHNPRPNELALAAYLKVVAARSHARLLVCSGHIHNYERHVQDGVLYLVSGGGGARPVPVIRDSSDAFQSPLFPNFHYLRLTLDGKHLRGEMYRLEDYDAPLPHTFALRDSFEIQAKSH
jgi:acid phosphatase type 7